LGTAISGALASTHQQQHLLPGDVVKVSSQLKNRGSGQASTAAAAAAAVRSADDHKGPSQEDAGVRQMPGINSRGQMSLPVQGVDAAGATTAPAVDDGDEETAVDDDDDEADPLDCDLLVMSPEGPVLKCEKLLQGRYGPGLLLHTNA